GGRGNRGGPNGAAAGGPADAGNEQPPEQSLFAELQANPSITLLPGMTPDAATESVAVSGNTAAPAFGGAFDPRQLDLANIPGGFGGPGGLGDQGFGGQAPGGQRGGDAGFGGPGGDGG